ncbi:hypothetical protein, partial [Streptomyces sp. b94]|uniref:hypothetical protein n=1 Tax=Streptomyces sp. b94 TaxID=1827634 RepID=UPI001C54F848
MRPKTPDADGCRWAGLPAARLSALAALAARALATLTALAAGALAGPGALRGLLAGVCLLYTSLSG